MARSLQRSDDQLTRPASLALVALLAGCTGQIGEPPTPAAPTPPSAVRSVRVKAAGAFATGPCFDPHALIDCPNVDELLPDAIQGILDVVEGASGLYTKIQSAQAVVQKLGEAMGLLEHTPTGDELILDLKSHLDQTARGVEWVIDAQFAANRYADEFGALIDAKQALDRGQPFDTSWVGWNDSIKAVISAGVEDIFRRTYSDDAVAGKWMQVIDERAKVDANGLSYDWRLGLPTLMQLIALRLQVMAAVVPQFRQETIAGGTVSPFAEEINNIREKLMTHYALIKDGVQCGRRQLGDGGNTDPFITACADVNTGISVVSSAGADVGSVQTRLEALLPLYKIKALVNSLAMYTDVSFKELTGSVEPTEPSQLIRNELDFRCLQATVVADGSSITSPAGCSDRDTHWTYFRETGVIRGGWTFDHCLDGDAGEGTFVGTAFADTACAHDQRAGHWTYDPISHSLMNGWGYFLRWGTMQSCDDFTGECTTSEVAINSRNPVPWNSEP
jgi:hypothetical protein